MSVERVGLQASTSTHELVQPDRPPEAAQLTESASPAGLGSPGGPPNPLGVEQKQIGIQSGTARSPDLHNQSAQPAQAAQPTYLESSEGINGDSDGTARSPNHQNQPASQPRQPTESDTPHGASSPLNQTDPKP